MLTQLEELLKDKGLPIIGIYYGPIIYPPIGHSLIYLAKGLYLIRVDWSRPVTLVEETLARTTIEAFDFIVRNPRPIMDMAQEIKGYILAGGTTNQQLNRLANVASMALAIEMYTRPNAAKQMGIPIEGLQ